MQKITAEAYFKVAQFVDERCRRGGTQHSYGANDREISIIKSVIRYLRNNCTRGSDCLVFYESGIGTGYTLQGLKDETNLQIYGCDVYLTEDIKNEFSNVHETTIKQSLCMLPDHFIDVIYWNDVMEHIPVDEIDVLFRLFAEKCKPGGLIITVTPSAYSGPHDITRLADPHAHEAHGLHLKEYSLKEVLEKYKKNGLMPAALVIGRTVKFSNVRLYYALRIFLEEILYNQIISHLIPKKIYCKFNYLSVTIAGPDNFYKCH